MSVLSPALRRRSRLCFIDENRAPPAPRRAKDLYLASACDKNAVMKCGRRERQLKLPTFLREYEKLAAEAAREGLDHVRFLLRLAELELIDRERRMVERRIRAARFPAVKSFDTFDFAAIPSLNKPLVLELARCEYVVARDNIIALGNSGTGKTHACLALGLAACQHGFSVAFFTAAGLVHQLMEARDERRLLKLRR
jgi:DNA replication protein DnaC